MHPFKPLLFCAFLGALPTASWSETVIRILHIQSNPKIRAIWQEAAQQYESAHPGVKVQLDYLENEAIKAKLPTLLESKDRPSAFQSWGGGVMKEQVNSKLATEGLFIPAVKGTADAIQDPLLKSVAQEVDKSQWIERNSRYV